MADYQLTESTSVIRTADGAAIPDDPANRDWMKYQEWLAAGGVPDPYVPPPDPGPQPDALAEAQRANARLDAGVIAAINTTNRQTKIEPLPKSNPTDPVTQAQFDALQTQVNNIEQAVAAMLQAQATPAPVT